VKEACVTPAGYQESLLSLFSRKGETREGSRAASRIGRRVRAAFSRKEGGLRRCIEQCWDYRKL
jgi:hypothetical protein